MAVLRVSRNHRPRSWRTVGSLGAVALAIGVGTAAAAATSGGAAALASGWLLRQADLGVAHMLGEVPQDTRHWQADIGGVRRTESPREQQFDAPLLPMVLSAILPGAGEIYLGRKRGFLMAALDIASWWRMAHNAKEGRDKRDEYYVFADAHWFEDKLDAAYARDYLNRQDHNPAYSQVVGIGWEYFAVDHFEQLPLWVSVVDDRREYYENLGKWDQFVFGWEDFADPRGFLSTSEVSIANLKDPRTSTLRERYRQLRQDSNDAFARRDRYLYLSIGLRVFSVLQVAYLEGLLTGNGGDAGSDGSSGARQFEIKGHRVDVIVEPVGLTRGVIAAAVSF